MKRAALKVARSEVSVVTRDSEIEGFNHLTDHRGGTVALSPMLTGIVDADLFREPRAGDDFRGAMRRQHPAAFDDLCDFLGRGGEDRVGRQADLVAQLAKRLQSPRVVDEVGGVFEEDHLERIGDPGARRAVDVAEAIDDIG